MDTVAPGPGGPEAPGPEPERLKLRAIDQDDLAVLAAALQDAIACVGEMAFLPDERRFVLVVSRFRWEHAVAKGEVEAVYERISCAVTIENVAEPKYRGFKLTERSLMMPLLNATFEDGAVILTFGGGAALRLDAEGLDFRMEDFGPAWPTTYLPVHGSNVS